MLAIERLSRTYAAGPAGRHVLAVDDVSLTVGEGEFLCLLGPSGCGKSTLLNLLAGFVSPTHGTVRFAGEPVTGPGPERAVVFQDAALFPWLNARRNVEFGLRHLPRKERRGTAEAMLAQVGLADFAHAHPHELPGGMRQRVAIARALALKPKVLLMDEPFGALDANTREHLQDELLRLWEAYRITVVFVTHNVQEAAYLADRAVVMGPAPHSLRGWRTVGIPRPRDRDSQAVLELSQALRQDLQDIPCCVAPTPFSELHDRQ
jgi:NitT/TauT family transport system ATP-binding protein